MRALQRPRGERVSLAAVLEEDLARSLRRVDTDAICRRSGEGSGEACNGERSGEAGHAEPGEACAPFVMIALVDSFCLNCEAGGAGARSAGVRLVRIAAAGPLLTASLGTWHLLSSVLEDSGERSCLGHLHPVSSRRTQL